METVAGTCPDCGTEMERRNFVDVWDEDGAPSEIYEDWWCPKCKLRWVCMEVEPMEAEA